MADLDQKALVRFWKKVRRAGLEECWEWTARKTSKGYGEFHLRGTTEKAHRVSYLMHNGRIPKHLIVMHTCDNSGCVNPRHLKVGTVAENQRHMVDQGRSPRGTQNGHCILRPEEVLRVYRAKLARGDLVRLAESLGVTSATLCDIRARRTWRHLTG